jgi:hypothetical protein
MTGVTFGKRKHGAIVRSIRNSDEMYCVEAVRLVPVVYRVVVPAPDGAAACRLALDVIASAPETGVAEYVSGSDLAVRDLQLMARGLPAIPVAVPVEFRPGFVKRPFHETP